MLRHFPSIFFKPMVSLKSRLTGAPLLKSQHVPIAVANATSVPAVTATSRKSDRLGMHADELIPRRHVGIQAPRLERRRHVEHQHFRVMIAADSGEILIPDRFRPSVDQGPDFLLILRCHGFMVSGRTTAVGALRGPATYQSGLDRTPGRWAPQLSSQGWDFPSDRRGHLAEHQTPCRSS